VNNYVLVPDNPSLISESFTVASIIYPSRTDIYRPIITKVKSQLVRLDLSVYYSAIMFDLNNGSSWKDVWFGNVKPYSWYFVAVTYNYGTCEVYGYFNTSKYNIGPYCNGTMLSGTAGTNIYIGTRPWEPGWFNGFISQVLIYSRALSAEEILWNYNYPDNPVRDGLVLWLHWDSIDIQSGKWLDKSGNNNHGTIYGATLYQVVKQPQRLLTPVRVLNTVR